LRNAIDMKRNSHNLNLGFIQLKHNVHFDSTDHDCPKETTAIRIGTKPHKIPRRVINAHAEVSIPQTKFSACAYQPITRKFS